MITDDRVLRIVGNSAREWKIANVQSFALMEWPESRVLAILLGDGSEPLIGVAPISIYPPWRPFLAEGD